MNVLITGGSRGIGNALVSCFEKQSTVDNIYVTSRNGGEDQGKVKFITLDFLESNWENSLAVLEGKPIHILINNAGYLYNGPASTISREEFAKMNTINYEGPFFLVQKLLPGLKEGKAHIINIGSMGGYQGSAKFPGLSAYSASKAALANLTECWAEEFKEFGIKSNCLALGAVGTEMLQEAFPGYEAPVTPQEMADKITDFAINFSSIINGKVIPVSLSTP